MATDGRGSTDTADVVVALIDSNDAPSVPDGQVLTVAEDAAGGAAVGTVSVSDPDSKEQWRSFTIMLVSDPNLGAADPVNDQYASSGAAGNAGSQGANQEGDGNQGQDSGSPGSSNDPANATDSSNSNLEVYRLFEMDPASGSLKLRPGQQLDWERKASYEVKFAVTDGGGLRTTASVTISVVDVPDAVITGYRTLDDTAQAIGEDGLTDAQRLQQQSGAGNATDISIPEDGTVVVSSVQYGTAGGDWVVLQGSGFSPAQVRVDAEGIDLSGYAISATYGPVEEPAKYTATGCYMVQPGYEVACKVQEGAGRGHVWSLRLIEASSGRDHTAASRGAGRPTVVTGYMPPSITSVSGLGGMGSVLSTRGSPPDNSVSLIVDGSNFGPVGTRVQLAYGPDLTFFDEGSLGVFAARDCRVSAAHVQVTCHPVAGFGADMVFVATAAGLQSSSYLSGLSYAPPEIDEVVVLRQQDVQDARAAAVDVGESAELAVEFLALGMDVSQTNALLSTHGIDTVYIKGNYFGPGVDALEGAGVSACYGPGTEPERYCVDRCVSMPTDPHTGVLCQA